MAQAQATDPDVQSLCTTSTTLEVREVPIPNSHLQLLCDVSTGSLPPVTENSTREKVFFCY